MSERINIFDQSHCLTEKQLQAYAHNKMSNAERYLVEQHISGCALCSDAVEGYQWMAENELQATLPSLPTLPKVVAKPVKTKQVDLNAHTYRGTSGTSVKRFAAAAALLIIMIGAGYGIMNWWDGSNQEVAQTLPVEVENNATVKSDGLFKRQETSKPKSPEIKENVKTAVAKNESPNAEPTATPLPPPAQSNSISDERNSADVNEPIVQAEEEKLVKDISATTKAKSTEKFPAPVQNNNQYHNQNQNRDEVVKSVEDISTKRSNNKKALAAEGPAQALDQDYSKDDLEDGKALFAQGKYESAITVFNKVIKSNSKYAAEAEFYLAQAYIRTNNHEKAISILNHIIEKNSGFTTRARQLLKEIQSNK